MIEDNCLIFKHERIQEWDTVSISGNIISEEGEPYVDELVAIVSTIQETNIKVWPMDSNDLKLPQGNDGKLWFRLKESSVKLLERF